MNVCGLARADYFAKHMGDYEGVLASLETLNLSILKAMDFTKKVCVCVFVYLLCIEYQNSMLIRTILLVLTSSKDRLKVKRWF